jgi:hypothetical protein
MMKKGFEDEAHTKLKLDQRSLQIVINVAIP